MRARVRNPPPHCERNGSFRYCAQFSQILNSLGYETLANSSRLFDDGAPFWRGLDGSLVLVRPSWENLGLPQVFAPGGCTRLPTSCCDGEGCPICGYRGMDISDENARSDETLARLFERMREIETGPLALSVTGEETLESEDGIPRLADMARRYGFMGMEIFTDDADPTAFYLLTRWTERNPSEPGMTAPPIANPMQAFLKA